LETIAGMTRLTLGRADGPRGGLPHFLSVAARRSPRR
jgi:hypothetical protein